MANGTNAGDGGVTIAVKGHAEEMEAFDRLSPLMRSTLQNAKILFSAKEAFDIIESGKMTEAQVIEAINA